MMNFDADPAEPAAPPRKLARTLRFDDSDLNVFEQAAEPDEWAVSGAFAFSNWSEADLTGKPRQAFSNGWLGLESFGRATFVAVAAATEREIEDATERLALHFIAAYGAPDLAAARPVAAEEIAFMADLCADHAPNTLLAVSRALTPAGVKESFRAITPQAAEIDAFAVHGD